MVMFSTKKIISEKLQNICTIQLGYQFRKYLEHDINGTISVIQMKDIKECTLNSTKLLKVNLDNTKADFYVNKGMILFMPRGFNNDAIFIKEDLKNTIASSQFYILKLTIDDVLPEYITWYLNQKPAQKYFKNNREGTSLLIVNIGQLKELEVKIPSLKIQESIVMADNMIQKEKKLYQEIVNKRYILTSKLLLSTINL